MQAVDLEDLSELYKTRLKLPGGIEDTDEDPLLIKFSSDLEVVFIGNILLGTKASDPEPIFLPLARVHKQSLGWSCSFSPCSTYIVLAYDPGFSSAHNHSPSPDHSAQLHIFHFDIRNKVYTRCSTQAVSLSQYDQQTFDFHPHLPELVLNTVASPIKYKDYVKDSLSGPNPGYTINDFKITTQLLDLEKGTAITLESPTIHGTLELGEKIVIPNSRD